MMGDNWLHKRVQRKADVSKASTTAALPVTDGRVCGSSGVRGFCITGGILYETVGDGKLFLLWRVQGLVHGSKQTDGESAAGNGAFLRVLVAFGQMAEALTEP